MFVCEDWFLSAVRGAHAHTRPACGCLCVCVLRRGPTIKVKCDLPFSPFFLPPPTPLTDFDPWRRRAFPFPHRRGGACAARRADTPLPPQTPLRRCPLCCVDAPVAVTHLRLTASAAGGARDVSPDFIIAPPHPAPRLASNPVQPLSLRVKMSLSVPSFPCFVRTRLPKLCVLRCRAILDHYHPPARRNQ